MSLIRKFNELETPKTVKVMVYGAAGSGKTTLALSAPSPLLLDFDRGVSRVNIEHLKSVDTIQVGIWEDVLQMFSEDLSSYKTIVVDTIGKMMDYIIAHKCGNRQPSIRDWGGINSEFQTFIRRLSDLGKHIVFIAHRDTRKEGDDTVYIPTLREKNYSSIITELDLLGYVEMKTEQGKTRRTITFDPTPRNDGKNTCNLQSVLTIPEIVNKKGDVVMANDTLTRLVIQPYFRMIQQKEDAVKEYETLIELMKNDVAKISSAEDANEFAKSVSTKYVHVGSSMAMLKKLFSQRISELSLEYDKKTKLYHGAQINEKPTQEESEKFQNSESLL